MTVFVVTVTNWQKINTAPKDNTRILLFRENWQEDMCIGFWQSTFEEWEMIGGTPFIGATHWAPLPESP